MKPSVSAAAREGLPWVWLALFLLLAFTTATVKPAAPAVFPLLAVIGLVHVSWCHGDPLRALLRRFRWLWGTLALVALGIAAAEWIARRHQVPGLAPALPVQVWLALCLLPLSVYLRDPLRQRAVILVFCAFSAWHFVAMPVEAIWGHKLTWHPVMLLPRAAGPLNYQASGLAWQAYYFPGLFLPLFYLGVGPWLAGRVGSRSPPRRGTWAVLCLLWLVPVICVQSRSAFAGAAAAALLALVAYRRPRHLAAWLVLAGLAGIAASLYWYLFAENKSGMDLRLGYYKLYLRESLRWPVVLTGHGFTLVPNLAMMAPGFPPLEHSHNDLIQTLYSWGLLTLAAYLAFWAGLVRLVWQRFVALGEVWPLCALLAFVPSLVTDLGYQHFEKAVFLMLFTAFCMAWADRPAVRD